MVEEVERSATTDEQNVNGENVAQSMDVEPELGEIAADEDSSSAKPSGALADQSGHPLEYSWTFSFDSGSGKSKQKAWGSSIRPIYTFSTVEEFWGLYNNIKRPQSLSVGTDFYCFKDTIEPKWEDPVCAKGGKWTANFSKGKSDTAWLYTLLAMIGEQFDHGDEICGAVVNIRGKLEKISIWTKNASNERAQVSIGKQWKEFLDYNDSIFFIVHEDAMEGNAKNRYML